RGDDTFKVNATSVDIASDAALSIGLFGGRGKDSIDVEYKGQVKGKLAVTTLGGPGDDQIGQNLTINAGSTGNVNALVDGGEGTNKLTLNVNDNSGGTLASLKAVIFAEPQDTVVHTPNVKVVIEKDEGDEGEHGDKGDEGDQGDNH